MCARWLCLVLLLGCADKSAERSGASTDSGALIAPRTDPDTTGPYDVGVRTMVWTDARGKELTAEVWSPAQVADDDEPADFPPITLTGTAVRNAQADLRFGPYPLVAFSHGYAGIRFQSIYLMELLAADGFVVVAPDHQHNTFLDLDEDKLAQMVMERPDDVRYSVDRVFERSEDAEDVLYGLTVAGNYAITGHSFGAFTSMILGGGQINFDGLVARCSYAPESSGCRVVDTFDPDALSDHGMSADRAVVTVPMSPGIWYAFGEDGATAPGLTTTRQPLVLGGDADPVLDYVHEIRPSFEEMAQPKTMVTFHGAGHYPFSHICTLAPFFSQECDTEDGEWMDIGLAQDISKTIVLAHIGRYLRGDDRFTPWLAPTWLADEPQVTVESP